jgi:hypothetical protein
MKTCSALLALVSFGAMGCDGGGGTDAGMDAGPEIDSGPVVVGCPTSDTPAPEEQMGPCCWRTSNMDEPRRSEPEMRLQYIELVEPTGSMLTTDTLGRILNRAMQLEDFNWLFRVTGADGDGPVEIITGFGRREADGTYAFSDGMDPDMADWCPVSIGATLTGETIASEALPGSITVPVFDDVTGALSVELTLRNLTIEEATWTEDRSCVGSRLRPFTYTPAGVLSAFIEVEPSRVGMVMVGATVNTTVCGVIAGSLNDPDYCDQDQSLWQTKPDSLCDGAGCTQNSAGMTDVCDPDTDCNAWHLVGNFAAAGVEVTGDLCP